MPDVEWISPPAASLPSENGSAGGEGVVLIHGLGQRPLSMWRIERRLARAGFATWNWGYRSRRRPIPEHAANFAEFLASLDAPGGPARLHLVGHSLGGIVIRCALEQRRPARLGRVVFLASPHGGSPWATRLAPWLGWLSRPMPQLTDAPEGFVRGLPAWPRDVEAGVIAAGHDLLVPRASTHLAGQADHITVPGLHLAMLWGRPAAEQTLAFLRTGRFDRIARPLAASPAGGQEPS